MPLAFPCCKELDRIVKRCVDVSPSQHGDPLGEHLGLPFARSLGGRRGRRRWQQRIEEAEAAPEHPQIAGAAGGCPGSRSGAGQGKAPAVLCCCGAGRASAGRGVHPASSSVAFRQRVGGAESNRGAETKSDRLEGIAAGQSGQGPSLPSSADASLVPGISGTRWGSEVVK